MNQIQNQQQAQPGEIKIYIKVENATNAISFFTTIDPKAPFDVFQVYVKDQIFAEVAQKTFDNLVYTLGSITIQDNEKRTLQELGFQAGSQLVVHLKVKGGFEE